MYLDSKDKTECVGCEACAQICGVEAISMKEDDEGFRYPVIESSLCVECKKCRKVCPFVNKPDKHTTKQYAFGGYNSDPGIRFDSTSGGAFSAIADAFCSENYVIFGAEAKGLLVYHSYTTDKNELGKYRKSKYSQSIMGHSYQDASRFLKEGKRVLFSGTPCQIAGLYAFLNNRAYDNLLTVEVICEGVPSPLYIRKFDDQIKQLYGSGIQELDYRYTGKSLLGNGKWDFEQMKIRVKDGEKTIVKDRWFTPFWSVWLQHLMSRPSCYKCEYTTKERVADITLGDLWGVHLYCPELYGKNGGSSLIVCNTTKGEQVFQNAKVNMYGHELDMETVVKYQGPMRKSISENPQRGDFMDDLKSDMSYRSINHKWAKRPTLQLLFQKYVWGNRQKIALWKRKQKIKGRGLEC